MAADVTLDPQPSNACCAELNKRYLKMEEKRNALRQAVKLLEGQTNKLQDENNLLKKACVEERKRADLAQQAKEKESDLKKILEKEIRDLKSELASLQENGNSRNQDRNHLLETRILQGEEEVKRLKELLQKEIKRQDCEKKKVEEEKKKTSAAWKLVKMQKSKAEEEKRIADAEKKKAEDMRDCLAKSISEACEAKEKLIEERSRADAASKKVELEKQKANREKKRADSERVKSEEQRMLVELERRKLMDEKTRADQLSKQLEEERQKREKLQEMEKIVCTRQGVKNCTRNYKTKHVSSSNEDGESANIRLLKDKLKLQKDKVKHAKKMAKLEGAEKQFLLQQLCLLKHDHMQISHRLEILSGCFSCNTEGIGGTTKVGGPLEQYAIQSWRKVVCAEHDFNSQIKTGKPKNNGLAMECLGPITPCTRCLPQKCGGRATRPISGISSDLESPLGDSVRDKSQNSAICSTDVTYSDTQLMGSQGKSAFAVATSVKLAKDNLQCLPSPELAGEETQNLHVAQQNNDVCVFHGKGESPCLNPIVHKGIEIAQDNSKCNMGKRRAQDILHGEDCSCCLNINKKNSLLEDLNSKSLVPSLCRPDDKNYLNGGKYLATELSDDSDTSNYKLYNKTKSYKCQKLGLQPSDRSENRNGVYGYEVGASDKACFVGEAALPLLDDTGRALICRNKSSDIVMNNQEAFPVDYIKLLELEDEADEERYQAAREMPLSPTLPELESPIRKQSADEYDDFVYGMSDGSREHKKTKNMPDIESDGLEYDAAPLCQGNLVDTSEENNMSLVLKDSSQCNQLLFNECTRVGSSSDTSTVTNQVSHAVGMCHASDLGLIESMTESGVPCDQVVSEHGNSYNILEKVIETDEENGFSIYGDGPRTQVSWGSMSRMEMGSSKQMPSPKAKHIPSGMSGHDFIVFSDTKDEQVISRVFCTMNAIMHDMSLGFEMGFLVPVLHALAVKLDLCAKEKACILFSLLLCKVSSMIPLEQAIYIVGDLSSDSFLAEMERVMSNTETRSLFLMVCQLDIFVSLVQDFLTARKLITCEEKPTEICTPDNVYHLDNGSRTCILRTAAINQLVAACVILASISTILGRVDILWQTSFQLLRACRGYAYWILTAVHVFASICGEKFFCSANHYLIVTIIKSLVLVLESGQGIGGATSNGNKGPWFSLCKKCPFAEGGACMDQVALLLLGELQNCIEHSTRHPNPKKSVIPSHNMVQECMYRADTHDTPKIQFDGPGDASCFLYNCVHQLYKNADASFCHFTDVVSLVELCSYYMGWEFLCNNILQQLFTLLEACSSSAFSVSLLVLVGQLGSIGVEAGGCQEGVIEELMCRLSTFLDMNGTAKSRLPVQFAAVEALLNLLPLDFREVVNGTFNKASLGTIQVVQVEHISRWFDRLGEEQKALSLRLLQRSDTKKS